MLTALAALSSLFLLFAACVTLWHMLAGNFPKIAAALQGRSLMSESRLQTRPITLRYRSKQMPSLAPLRTAAHLRAAA